jgi:hypothetical protein
MNVSHTITANTDNDLIKIGEIICQNRDWRWTSIWSYNVHRLLKPGMKQRKIWDDLDALIRTEWDWHLGRDLFQQIRKVTIAQEKEEQNEAERAYLRLGEVTAKCISNASWRPGLFDLNAPWQVPALAMKIVDLLGDDKQRDFLQHHFKSLAANRYSDRPYK